LDSVPKHVLQQWADEGIAFKRQIAGLNTKSDEAQIQQIREKIVRAYFRNLDRYLDGGDCGPNWLRDARLADTVKNALHFFDAKKYALIAFCIMSNHVHLLITPLMEGGVFLSLASIMHSLKRYTSRECNKLLNRTGSFWAAESFDHYVRDEEELSRTVRYILNNPVKAGLVSKWED